MKPANDPESIRDLVRDGYAAIARAGDAQDAAGSSCCGPSGGCRARSDAADLAREIGYSAEEVGALPAGANMGLSCGNPAAIASLSPGEVVLDLGSGGGLDCFLIGPKVGATGRAIGVDMTPEMLGKARRNLATYRRNSQLDNVEFRLGEIEHLPVADASVDVVISNCVLNLSPDKPQVWREIARVLKPGGRVAISDLALQRALPASVRASVEALVGCVAGAVLVEEVDRAIRDAGLVDVRLQPKPEYVATLESFEDPLYRKIAAELPAGTKTSDFITSLDIQARKPGVRAQCC